VAKPELPLAELRAFCAKWKIAELAVFGSYLREDFGPESHVDFLVTWKPDADWSLLDVVRMEAELGDIVGRKIDLVLRRSIERSRNRIRRDAILSSARPVVSG
jgi:hypothetical protein